MDLKNTRTLILSLLAMVLLISSEVSARGLTDTSTNTKNVVEKKIGGRYGYRGYSGGYRGIGVGFAGNNGGYFGVYPNHGGRNIGGYPYHNGGYYANGFPINVGGYHGNRGGYNVGYNGGGFRGRIGRNIGGHYFGSHNGDVVDVNTKDNTHN